MRPLHGIKVCDLSRVLAGPYATQILADLGATVLKVEEPSKGDETRHWGPPYFENTSSYYLTANRNKNAIALDFKSQKDLSRLHKLLSEADVLVENFKVGNLKHYGLDYDSLKTRYPKLIYCSITGFGQTGPLSHDPGYDVLIQALAGLMSITGPNAQTPTKVGVAVADLATGLYAVISILAALRERDSSQLGQHIDLSLYDTQVSLLANIGMNFLTTKQIPQAMGNHHPSIVPYGTFETKDRPILLSIGNDHQFERLSLTLGEDWHHDSRFSTNESRVKNREALEGLMNQKLQTQLRDHWLKRFHNQGFPFGPIQNLEEIENHPHTKAREIFTTMDDGRTPCIKSPMRFSRTPIESYRKPPRLNQDPDFEWPEES